MIEESDAVILDFTELPLIFKNSTIRTIDTLKMLVEAIARELTINSSPMHR